MAAVFLVEDEVLIRMMVADMVTDLGHTVAAEAGDLQTALELASNAVFDVAVLDVMLGKDSGEPVAEALAARSIPFAFATGFGADGVPEVFRGRPRLQKPYPIEQLERCLGELLHRPWCRNGSAAGAALVRLLRPTPRLSARSARPDKHNTALGKSRASGNGCCPLLLECSPACR